MGLVEIARDLRRDVEKLRFRHPVTHVYDPLAYAWRTHALYLRRYGNPPKQVLLLGMNPGPWGMAQTGVPFGEVTLVRDWLGIDDAVSRPAREHPKRRVDGFACRRSEVSGRRLWGWARARFETPERFFARFFVHNYCPLLFLEASGRNRTPDRLPSAERGPLFAACDKALRRNVAALKPAYVLGVGRFAEARARAALAGENVVIAYVPHPSPASPTANRGWEETMDRSLAALEVEGFGRRPARR